jgi:catechol-2,3-dioxygenase
VAAIERGLSWSVHTTDPDGNRVEVFCDTGDQASGRTQWAVTGRALSLDELQQAREDDRLAAPVA